MYDVHLYERETVQRANGVTTAGAGSKPDHAIDAAVADKFTPLKTSRRIHAPLRSAVHVRGVSHPRTAFSPAYCTHASEQHG